MIWKLLGFGLIIITLIISGFAVFGGAIITGFGVIFLLCSAFGGLVLLLPRQQ